MSLPLTTIVNSYLYQEYADDDDLQAFVAAYNNAAQTSLDWFNSVQLPIYTGLTGGLLDWVAEGLYGFTRSALASPATPALGMLNTEVLNTVALNSFVPSSTTYYTLDDDVFSRILTWNFYKGDGKRFCMRWLKRRIARFLYGVNGVDPNPFSDPAFTVGVENTLAISAVVSGTVLTVSINQILLSLTAPISPGVLTLFQIAFEGGALELPLQYTSFVCNIVASLTATVLPLTATAVGTAVPLATPSATVTVVAGSGSYTYAWTWMSGGTGITIASPSATTTDFTGSPTVGGTLTGVALCTITDTVEMVSTTVTVPVTLARISAVALATAPTTLSVTNATSTINTGNTVATASGGAGPYGYAWTWQSGGFGLTINNPNSATTNFTANGIAPNTLVSGVALCTVTDSYGQTASATTSVTISRVSSVSVSAAPTGLSSSGTATTQSTATTTATASGGSGSYTYHWTWASGGTGLTINTPNVAGTYVIGASMAPRTVYSGTLRCTATDGYGQTGTVTVPVTIDCTFTGNAVFKFGTYTKVIGGGASYIYYYGYSGSSAPVGTLVSSNISASTLYAAETSVSSASGVYTTTFALSTPTNVGQSFFTTLAVSSLGTLSSASATYSYASGTAYWTWSNNFFTSGTVGTNYTITLT
jgi:hypothetical protein